MKPFLKSSLVAGLVCFLLLMIAVPTTRSRIANNSETTYISGKLISLRDKEVSSRDSSITQVLSLRNGKKDFSVKICIANCAKKFSSVFNPKDLVIGTTLGVDAIRNGKKETRGLYIENLDETTKEGTIIKIFKQNVSKSRRRTQKLLLKEDLGQSKSRIISVFLCLGGCKNSEATASVSLESMVLNVPVSITGKINKKEIFNASKLALRLSPTPTFTPTNAVPTTTPTPTPTVLFCAPFKIDNLDCTSEVPHSLVATKTRHCNAEGTIYNYGICTVTSCQGGYLLLANLCITPAPCALGDKIVLHGESIPAYFASAVPGNETCQSEIRNCNNGALSGSFQYSSCLVGGVHCSGRYMNSTGGYVDFQTDNNCTLGSSGGTAACRCDYSAGLVTVSQCGSGSGSVAGAFTADCQTLSMGGLNFARQN